MADELTNEPTSFARRMVYSLLRPAARMADRLGVGLKDFVQLSQLALYDSKKSRGLTQKEIAEELDVSSRTTDRLVKAMREGFFEPEEEHELPRQIEFVLWAEAAGLARLAQILDGYEEAEIERALDVLLESGRVKVVEGRTTKYAATSSTNRIFDHDLATRIDALNNVLTVIEAATQTRFVDDDTRAAARTVSMRVRNEDIGTLAGIYEEYVWPRLVKLDERASDAHETIEMGLTMVWSPIEGTKDED